MPDRRSKQRSDKIRRKINEQSHDWVSQAPLRVSTLNGEDQRNGLFSKSNPNENTGAKKKRSITIGWRLLSFILVLVLGYIIVTAWQSPDFRVNDIKITGLKRLAPTDISQTLNIDGQYIFAIQPIQIKRKIEETYPELTNVNVGIHLPASITIHVAEMQPEIAWLFNNQMIWIDGRGRLIPAVGDAGEIMTISGDHPPIYVPIGEQEEFSIIDKKDFYTGGLLSTFFTIPKRMDANLLSAIIQLYAWLPNEDTLLFEKERGIGWRDIRGWNVFMGSKLENINDKMVMYETIVRELENEGIKPSMVSVEFLHAPFFRVDE